MPHHPAQAQSEPCPPRTQSFSPDLGPAPHLISPGPESAPPQPQLQASPLATLQLGGHGLDGHGPGFHNCLSDLCKTIHLIVSCLLQTSHLPTALCMKSKSLSTPSRPAALANLLPPLGLVACCPSDLIQPSHPPGRQALPPRPDQVPFCGVSEHPVPLMWSRLHGVVSLPPQDQEPSLSVPPCTLGALHL